MSLAFKQQTTTAFSTSHLADCLAVAQQRIERSFLEGGEVLVSVMEAIGYLTKTLDSLTTLFDPQSTQRLAGQMTRALDGLAGLPAAADSKQASFVTISDLCNTIYKNVNEMREIIRYLRTITVTVKITGASLSEFSGFAEEIRERIQSVSDEVDRFAGQLIAMRDRLGTAVQSSDNVIRDFSAAIPPLVENLDRGMIALADQQRRMTLTANELKQITDSIQMKIGRVLSALQIGDITRQRIEHIITALGYHNDFKASNEGRSVNIGELERVEKAVNGLAKAQLEEAVAEFHAQCADIAGTIASFTADAAQVMSLRDELTGSDGEGDGNILTQMRGDIARAADLSHQVLNRTCDLDTVVASVDQSTQSLITGLSAIRRIKLDIFYMALNSNLACTKLGESGRAVNVVSGELRVFADRLEGPAESIVVKMQEIENAKAMLTPTGEIAIDRDGYELDEVQLAVDSAVVEMSSSLAALSKEGACVFRSIDKAIRTLDFRSGLGDVLDDCLRIVAATECVLAESFSGGNSAIDELSARIFNTYTMAEERNIHRMFLPVAHVAAPEETVSVTDDDDFFGELF